MVAFYSHQNRLSLHRFEVERKLLNDYGMSPIEVYLKTDGIISVSLAA